MNPTKYTHTHFNCVGFFDRHIAYWRLENVYVWCVGINRGATWVLDIQRLLPVAQLSIPTSLQFRCVLFVAPQFLGVTLPS